MTPDAPRAFARFLLSALVAAGAIVAADVDILTIDSQKLPIAGVRVELQLGGNTAADVVTGTDGHARFKNLTPGIYSVVTLKDGFEPLRKSDLDLTKERSTSLELTLTPAAARRESVEVKDTVSAVEDTSPPTQLPPQVVRELPGRPPTVTDALPLVPGVVRQPQGGLAISGAGEHRSAMIVNSADVTDPATGQFGVTVPIDIVESLNVYQTPYLAEYGRFTAGLVSVETRRGSDQWKWEINDPFPDFFIRSWHLRGLRDATPRLNFEGPLIPGKLYFSQGIDYEIRKTPVYELTFPDNLKKQEGFNSFSQLDWIVSNRQLLTLSLHVAPQSLEYVNLSYFNPPPTTPDAGTQNYTSTLGDKLTIWGGLLDNTLSFTRFNARVWGQGSAGFDMFPTGNTGNYFEQQNRQASRFSWQPSFAFGAFHAWGVHNFKVGANLAETVDDGEVTNSPVNLFGFGGPLLERVAFTGGQPFNMSDNEAAMFGQDHWLITPRLAVDIGVRTESQEVSESFRVAPRLGIAWTPFAHTGTVVRAGAGLFYDRVPLNVYSFSQYPNEVITTFDATGTITSGPTFYQNELGTVTARYPFVFKDPTAGNFSPHTASGSLQVEQPISSFLKLRAGYLQSESSGLVVMDHIPPDTLTGIGSNILSGNGHARYHQFETTARLRVNEKSQLVFSYVRSLARGDLNDFSTFLGTFAQPVLRTNEFGNLPTNLPNRFLTWGLIQLPRGWRISPLIEYRSGFPYAVLDAAQNWVGIPYSTHFPNFFSLDARIAKDIKVSPKYTLRFSVSGFNLTDHFNPEAVHSNIDDPLYGYFFGQRGRHLTADFDVIF